MNRLIDYYSNFDEWGRLDREPLEFFINWHYMKKYLPFRCHVLDNGAGPGKYSMALAKEGYRVTLSDVTPRLVEVAQVKAAELGIEGQFDGFHVLNAVKLAGLRDNLYDASFMLGPLYHLQKEEERILAVSELHRVTKPGGIVFVAFQSRMRMTLTSLQLPRHWRPHDSMDAIQAFRSSGVFNHADSGRFTNAYYFDLEEITPFMESHGFETIQLIGSSSIGGLLSQEQIIYWEERGDYPKLLDLLIELAQDPSILGVSSHLLYIGLKKA